MVLPLLQFPSSSDLFGQPVSINCPFLGKRKADALKTSLKAVDTVQLPYAGCFVCVSGISYLMMLIIRMK